MSDGFPCVCMLTFFPWILCPCITSSISKISALLFYLAILNYIAYINNVLVHSKFFSWTNYFRFCMNILDTSCAKMSPKCNWSVALLMLVLCTKTLFYFILWQNLNVDMNYWIWTSSGRQRFVCARPSFNYLQMCMIFNQNILSDSGIFL